MDDNFVMSQNDWDTIIAYSKMSHDKWKTEIGGMCVALFDEEAGTMVIKDPVIGKQEVSSVNCTIDKEWLADYYMEMAMKHGTKVRFVWWHSHHTMGVGWSSTDTNTMEECNKGDYSMSLVVNLKEDHTFRISWWKPTTGYIDTKLKVLKPAFKVDAAMQAKFDELITQESRVIRSNHYSSINNTSYTNWNSRFKQPGNYGPGYVDAELMDKTPSLQEKYCATMDALLEAVFVEQIKWPDFKEKWSDIIKDAGMHNIIIETFNKNDYGHILLRGEIPDATDYFESPEPELFLVRDSYGYGNKIQKNLWDV